MTSPTTKRDSAIQLAQFNYRVFPLPPGAKHPPPLKFYEVATSDTATVAKWWTNPVTGESTDHNIGVLTGGDLAVIDTDDPTIELDPDLYPLTQMVKTPRGYHRYYEVDEEVACSASRLAKGIDVRGHHGYVVGPGSETDRGVYAWANDKAEAKAPAELIELCGKPGARAINATDSDATNATGTDTRHHEDGDTEGAISRTIKYLKGAKPAIEGDGGERATYEVACRVRDYGVSREMCVELMAEHWNDRCEPPWDIDGLRLKTENAYKYAQNKFGVKAIEFEAVPDGEVEDRRLPPARPEGVYRIGFKEGVARAGSSRLKHLIKDLLGDGQVSCMYGDSNVGKSFVALDLAFHVAAGLPWQGRAVRQGEVTYVAAEGGAGIYKRLAALAQHYGLDDVPLFVVPCPIDLSSPVGDVKALIDLIGPNSVFNVIDTLSRALAGGDENSSKDMGAFIKNVDRIRTATSGHTMLVHHTGKDASRGARGWSGIRAAIDTEIEVARGSIEITKQRDIAGDVKIGFELKQVRVCDDTSCVVALTTASEFKQQKLTPQEQEFFDVVEAAVHERSQKEGVEVGAILFANNYLYAIFAQNCALTMLVHPPLKPNQIRNLCTKVHQKGYFGKGEGNQWFIR